jgi:hypothetical protein
VWTVGVGSFVIVPGFFFLWSPLHPLSSHFFQTTEIIFLFPLHCTTLCFVLFSFLNKSLSVHSWSLFSELCSFSYLSPRPLLCRCSCSSGWTRPILHQRFSLSAWQSPPCFLINTSICSVLSLTEHIHPSPTSQMSCCPVAPGTRFFRISISPGTIKKK